MSFFGNKNRAPSRPKRSPTPNSGTLSRTNSRGSASNEEGAISKPLYLCSPFADSALVKGNFKTIVMLPKYVDITEWVAVNIFDFYTHLNEFYGVITECCTQQTCPTMSAGANLNYLWTTQDRKQVSLSAPTYIDSVMSSIQTLLDDENVFPSKSGESLFSDAPEVLHLRSEPHFNSLFAHFLAFGWKYELLDAREIKGEPNAPVGVGLLWERWRNTGILEA
ncbi:related to MOB2-required for maintenance in ploidy [Armillaria ostoyae]|uniref:Related to MOB2-required for maintenance in ploidy n=1 Tax=Armillaria ostoyae TaxID=47428 RepID=A0A284RFW2_ARMOS|nr:related to MOB2-required for maintenance in ploidy [Armillaria ostoyae]